MGTNYYMVRTKPTLDAPLHIGKNSCGWKFLFHYVDYNWEHEVGLHSYYQWKTFIENKVKAATYVILDEYERVIEPEDFFEIVERAQNNDNPDNFKYNMNIDGYRFSDREFC